MKLIVDGDLLVFRSCAAVEHEVPVDHYRYLWSSMEDATGVLLGTLHDLTEQANTDDVVFAFSDSQNWRRNIYKDYKSNRKDMRKPLCFHDVIEYVEAHFEVLRYKGLEADDVLGIHADDPDTAIWTLDKDLKQCPGLHLMDDELVTVTKPEGDRFHLYQTLIGDVTDGYKGCPGMGDKGAVEFLDAPYVLVPTEREIQRGKRQGEIETRWEREPTDDVWAGIVSLYAKAGLSEQDALVQARIARILRKGEYDFKKQKVKLWKPISK